MRDATHVVNRNPNTINTIDAAICGQGTPNGILIIMAIGEVKGIIDSHIDKVLSGLLTITDCDSMIVKMSGMVTGSINCCVSVSLSTADPTAANNAL